MRYGVAWRATAAVAGALTLLVAWSFWQRWTLLTTSPFPVGIDGYFYPIQLRSLLEHGTLAYPASPLAFWVMAPLAALTDPITGAKLGAALFGALIALPAYGVGAHLGKSRGAGLLAAALMTTSAGSQFLTIEFVKNGVGLTVAMTALWLVLRALATPSRGRILAAGAGVIAALLAHKMAAGIVLVIAVPAAISEAVGRGLLRGRRLFYVLGAGTAFALGVLVLGLVAPERFLSPDDLGKLGALWTAEARWDAPALALPRVELPMGHEAVIGGVLALVAGTLLATRPPTRSRGAQIAAWAIVGIALVVALPWIAVSDPMGLGFRLRIVAFVPMALCAALIAHDALVRLPSLVARGLPIALALGIVVGMPRVRTTGRVDAHPAMVAAVQGLNGRLPAGATMIIPERHIMFMVAWYTRAPIRLRPEAIPHDQRWRVMPLAFIGAGSELDAALMKARTIPALGPPLGTHPRHPNGLVLVPEATWDWVLAQLRPQARAYYTRWRTI